MPNVRERRILRSGGAMVVSLPPDWLRGNGLSAGDVVELTYDGIIRIRAPKKNAASGVEGRNLDAPARQPAQRADTDEMRLADDGS
jgi:antitoxin component of MazEF toxin-antitoxin module